MSGTIPSLSLSTQFDKNGKLLKGGKLYTMVANNDAPQSLYKDTGLSLPHPNPITLDATGRVPEFYCADGSIRARLVDKSGIVQFHARALLVIGPSSGGGGGASVDPATIFGTGDPIWLPVTGTRTGWVRLNGRSIGSATSGAQERANSDCQSLYSYIWQNFPDAHCPVAGGRGANAAADWAANKPIATLDMRGRGAFGLDDMGNAAANRLLAANVTSGGGDDTTTGAATGGEGNHTLTIAELAAHDHGGTGNPTTHPFLIDISGSHNVVIGSITTVPTGGGVGGGPNFAQPLLPDHVHSIPSQGGGNAHNNMPPFVLGTWYMKL
jgi:microcystin-dependent protein